MSAAADKVDQVLLPRYEQWYGGMALDHGTRTLTVYRKPGSDLDGVVRGQIGEGFTVVFRPAPFSRKAMEEVVSRVTADISYWHGRGVTVTGVAPQTDASGIVVMTDREAKASMFSARYSIPVTVQVARPELATGAAPIPREQLPRR